MSVNGETGDFENSELKRGQQDSNEKIISEEQKLRIELEKISAELNARKRELEIEAALEKVRGTAMGMHQSEDLRKVVQILYDQLRNLGFQSGVASITIMDPETGDIDWWMEGFDAGYFLPERYHVPFFNHPGHQQQLAHWKSGTSYAEIEISGQEKKAYDAYYFFQTDFARAPESSKQLMMQQETVRFSMAFMKYGALSWSPSPLSHEQSKILERFARVFEQSYTRFLDLQKAEAQAREAQIEGALEKVRSTSLAMHNSDELENVVVVLFEKLNEIGLSFDAAFIYIYDKSKRDLQIRVATKYLPEPVKVILPFDEEMASNQIVLDLWDAIENESQVINRTYAGKTKADYFRFAAKHNHYPEHITKLHLEADDWIISFAAGKNSVVGFDSFVGKTTSEEDFRILQRFEKVFEQSYTRFLDLQKAEAQAREAQIEAALERVRSASMAMHNSDELQNVIKVLTDQLTFIGFPFDTANFIVNESMPDWEMWISSPGSGDVPPKIHVDYFDHRLFKERNEAVEKGESFLTAYLDKNEKNLFLKTLFEKTLAKHTPEERKKWILEQPGMGLTTVLMKTISLSVINYQARLYSAKENEVIKRFATVFEQSYVRFLDLQKAEAQVREAQIEAALERVRSRAMAMHSSHELKEVARELRKQMGKLGQQDLETCAIHLYEESLDYFHSWAAVRPPHFEGEIIESEVTLPKKGGQLVEEMLNAYFSKNQEYVLIVDGEKANEWLALVRKHFPQTVDLIIESRSEIELNPSQGNLFYFSFADFRGGSLVMVTYTPPDEESRSLLARFANVFGIAYRRFSDLQKAEAQAREAKIEAALERVRSKSLAMHHSDELERVVLAVSEQLSELGLLFDGTLIFISDSEKRKITLWISTYQMPAPLKVHLPFDSEMKDNAIWKVLWNSIKKEESILNKTYSGKTKDDYFRYVQKYNSETIPPPVRQLQFKSPNWSISYAAEKNSMLGVDSWSGKSVTEEEFQILIRFGRVFEQAFIRFLDLQKAEEQAREAQIQLALERLRARTMAMHQSSEVAEAAAVMWEQLTELGASLWICGFNICSNSSDLVESWVSPPDGNQMGPMLIPYSVEYFTTVAYERWKNQGEMYSDIMEGDELQRSHKELLQHPSMAQARNYLIENNITMPTWVQRFAVPNKVGYLTLVVTKPFHEPDILVRFSKVFEQTYTRFLDLQKAEAQTREAQIETSLERIRAASLAMKDSAELGGIIYKLYSELTKLDAKLDRAFIMIVNPENRGMTWWMAGHEGLLAENGFFVQMNQHASHLWYLDCWKERRKKWQYLFEGEEKRDMDSFVLGETELSKLPEFIKNDMASVKKIHLSGSSDQFGSLVTGSFEPLPDEQQDIISRFSIAFNQAYVRFLDLQKAEAQAREAQIEAALERVRSRSLAMHNSEELREVVSVLYEQMESFGFARGGCELILCNEKSGFLEYWHTNPVQSSVPECLNVSPSIHDFFDRVWKAWKEQEPRFVIEMRDEEKHKMDRALFEQSDFKKTDEKTKNWILNENVGVFSHATMKYGLLEAVDYLPLSEDQFSILQRFAKVFEQTYTRFLDLQKAETQAREAQIEAALERVRSRSLAMHSSIELKEVITVVIHQFVTLGFDLDLANFNYLSTTKEWIMWLATPEYTYPELLRIPAIDHPLFNRPIETLKKGLNFMSDTLSQEEFRTVWPHFYQTSPLKDYDSAEKKEYIAGCTGFARSIVFMKQIALTISNFKGVPYTEEQNNILKRFGKVFEQTYTRFLDLQKAEAQAREAQIEAALEKVRSSSLAMHKGEDLKVVMKVVFEKLKELGLEFDVSGIQLYTEGSKDIVQWVAAPDLLSAPIQAYLPFVEEDHRECEILKDIWEAKELGKAFCNKQYSFDEKNKFFEYAGRHNDFTAMPEEVREFQLAAAGYTQTIVPEKRSALWVDSYFGQTIPKEGFDILVRFARVFEQAYTRFLDLQKAEAQAREAQIEAALERVRARTMGMQKSADLRQVVKALYDQLKLLGFQNGSAAINIMDPDSGDIDSWGEGYDDGYDLPEKYHVSYSDLPGLRELIMHWKSGAPYAVVEITGKDKKSLDNYYFFHTDFAKVPETTKQFMMQQEIVVFSMAYMRYGALTWTPGSLSEEQAKILQRFSKVFEQSYTRFLDLQKAEAQAREAQIEAALEKVRSRTMAMQNSEELADAAYVLFEQLNILGVTHERINIGIVNEANQQIDFWVTEQGGQKLQTKFSGRISEPTTLSKSYDAWKRGAKSLVVDLQGEELQTWLRYLEEEIKIPFNKAYLHNRRVQTAGFFSKGMLIVTSPEPLQDEALYLLEKFAKVFDLTYTRFNDLLLAEAQAIRAKENLIAIHAAKSKAEEALTELKATQSQLVQQEKLASLGQLTAGIAHEIKNPLNFVNNFSEVSLELIEEALEEIAQIEANEHAIESAEILADIKSNLTKIHEHGTRANSIVSSMLQHSRGGSGKMEPTDLNSLIKEYVNLSFHGMRAGKNPIDVDIILDLDQEIKEVPLIKEDFTRVIINLCNNAFDAMRGKVNSELYNPKLTIRTKAENNHILLEVADNGPGIPDEIKDKILQPFFTTKKGTEGTGLGLSITHDIVKAHGGKLEVRSTVGIGTEFIIQIPTDF